MRGKHRNPLLHAAAWARSWRLRQRLKGLVNWEPLDDPQPGCTIVIGMCSRLPSLLVANLRCLAASRWPDLKAIVVAVDAPDILGRETVEVAAKAMFPGIPVEFAYYSEVQASVARRINLPCPHAWLSWCVGISRVRTRHVLIHDYDALILGRGLERRYRTFCESNAVVQGVTWYATNGIEEADHLVTTFEQLCDASWLRSLAPLDLFNVLRVKDGRSIHYDITLDVQERLLNPDQRQVEPMTADELVHPSQMIHQYTMFKRRPAKRLPCFSVPLIPFFSFLGGDDGAIARATQALRNSNSQRVDLVGDGTLMNLELLDTVQVDWALKQIVQAAVRLGLPPSHAIYEYGTALYSSARSTPECVWKGDFTPAQRHWIDAASRRRIVGIPRLHGREPQVLSGRIESSSSWPTYSAARRPLREPWFHERRGERLRASRLLLRRDRRRRASVGTAPNGQAMTVVSASQAVSRAPY